ncbi:major facilitator superfamily domain-containing protein [Exophiala viscosa]|uniref:Major facilitator superfamily domain-containing protein n=1 Tax=Exophiala viscosa TaxID=2486360 RepID=A0AAN6IEH4_9EURO|nr:major facilitator superfamily domain-containing protein [Exophiala viscosa]
MAVEEPPSEISPLLGPQHNGGTSSTQITIPVETGTATDEPVDVENAIGRTDSVDESRAAQFKGNPDVIKQLKYIVPAVSIGVFLAAADQTIIVSSYGRIGSDLDALNLTSWIATSYFLTLTSFQPLYGKLSDIFGRKPCLLFAYTIFGLGCLFCGLARNINELIAARVVQGIGGGGMSTVVSILFSDIVPLKDRGLWQGIINIVYASGASTGAPLGGLLADYVGWRWSFIGQVPLCLAAFIAAWLTLQLPAPEEQDWKKKLRRIDFLGAAVLIAAVFGLIFGMDRGSNVSWSIPISYVPLIASVVLFGVLIYVETRVAAEPFAPGHIIFERTMFAAYLCNFFSFAGWLAAIYYLPLFYQAVDGLSATGAAVRMIPAIISGVLGSLFGGIRMRKTGRYYWLTVGAYALLVLGMVFVLIFSGLVLNNTYAITVGIMLCAFGNGIGVTTSLIALIANAAPEDQAVATACSYLFRSLGSVIGISLSATVIQQRLRNALASRLGNGKDAQEIEEGVRRSLDYLKKLEPGVRKLVRQAYGDAITHGYGMMLGIVSGAAIASWFLREKRLSR